MDRQHRSSLVGGLLLIILGGIFLAFQLVPGLRVWADFYFAWPLFIIGAGALLLLIGLAVGAPGMAVPAAIVGGIGALLYWQNATNNWESWAYAWALIPGFVGVGIIVAGLLGDNNRRSVGDGLRLVIISLVLFFVFASFLGGWNLLGPYWPVLIILLGLWVLVRPMLRARNG
jgi:peptidoglycan/LPS O-acetylase OafA/YrhL